MIVKFFDEFIFRLLARKKSAGVSTKFVSKSSYNQAVYQIHQKISNFCFYEFLRILLLIRLFWQTKKKQEFEVWNVISRA